MKAQVVIGAGFGDEGKGLVTDYLVGDRGSGTLVVRFSGGANSGHTVQLADGTRHAFGHFGAGTFAGADTFLSRFFYVNPLLWMKESKELRRKVISDSFTVYVDESAPLTTPYDMLINQVIEKHRGRGRHGSVGVGINETYMRNQSRFALYAKAIGVPHFLVSALTKIRDIYVPERLASFGITMDSLSDFDRHLLSGDSVMNQFGDACALMLDDVTLLAGNHNIRHDRIVFEGSQGLLLDEDHRFFPHVTRSKIGLKNVVALAKEMRIDELETYYTTRTYMTRHGAGPFPSQNHHLWYEDKTNQPNDWQGSLRFGFLDIDLIAEAVNKDVLENRDAGIRISPHLAVTCCDQAGADDIGYIWKNDFHRAEHDKMIGDLMKATKIQSAIMSYGPTRDGI